MPSEISGNPVWLIVGGSRGIGLEIVKQVAEDGARVIATARDLKKAPGLQSLLQTHGEGGALEVVTLDVADAASIKVAALEVAASHPEGIDYLVINAGTNDNHVQPSLDLDLDEFKRVFNVNVFGAFAAIQAFFPLLKAKEGGRKVVAVISSSEASVSPISAAAKNAAAPLGPLEVMLPSYRASKAALNRFTMQLASEYKHDGVVFAAIHPGGIETDMAVPIISQLDPAVMAMVKPMMTPVEESVRSQVALLKAATPETLNGRFVNWKGEDMPW